MRNVLNIDVVPCDGQRGLEIDEIRKTKGVHGVV